jgi:hypothetical protein
MNAKDRNDYKSFNKVKPELKKANLNPPPFPTGIYQPPMFFPPNFQQPPINMPGYGRPVGPVQGGFGFLPFN